ncbi:hypothetical protein HC891_05715 [Candidatus Gracilibacteria bacterium]|nr:hypothetical protein [Candidatus Gracilibacteria bacterium]
MANNDDRPSYGRSAREQYRRDTTSWIPGPVRRWLGLDYDEPARYGGSSGAPRNYNVGRSDYQASRSSTYQPQRLTNYSPADQAAPPPSVGYREAGYPPGMTQAEYDAAAADVAYRANYTPSYMNPDGTPGAPGPFYETTYRYAEGVQPVGYLLKGYARGALPPQGLEAFTRQFNDTVRDVYNFYDYWIRFQAEDLGRIFVSLRDGAVSPASGASVEHVPVETAPMSPVPPMDVAPLCRWMLRPSYRWTCRKK